MLGIGTLSARQAQREARLREDDVRGELEHARAHLALCRRRVEQPEAGGPVRMSLCKVSEERQQHFMALYADSAYKGGGLQRFGEAAMVAPEEPHSAEKQVVMNGYRMMRMPFPRFPQAQVGWRVDDVNLPESLIFNWK